MMLKNTILFLLIGMLFSACTYSTKKESYSTNIDNFKKDIFSIDKQVENLQLEFPKKCVSLVNEFTKEKNFKKVLQNHKINLKTSSSKAWDFYNDIEFCVKEFSAVEKTYTPDPIKKIVSNYYDKKFEELQKKDLTEGSYDHNYNYDNQYTVFNNYLSQYYMEHVYEIFPAFLERKKEAEMHEELLIDKSGEIYRYFWDLDYQIVKKNSLEFGNGTLQDILLGVPVTPEVNHLYERPCSNPDWYIVSMNGDSKGTLFSLNMNQPHFAAYPYLNPKIIYIYGKNKYVDDAPLQGCIFKYRGIYEYITVMGAKKIVYAFENYDKQYNSIIRKLYFYTKGLSQIR